MHSKNGNAKKLAQLVLGTSLAFGLVISNFAIAAQEAITGSEMRQTTTADATGDMNANPATTAAPAEGTAVEKKEEKKEEKATAAKEKKTHKKHAKKAKAKKEDTKEEENKENN